MTERVPRTSGLPAGRPAFTAALDDWCAHMRAAGEGLAVLCVDLGSLKRISAAFGHNSTLAVSAAVSRRLRTRVSEALSIAQLADDEFALVLPVDDQGGAMARAHQILDLLEAPLELEDGTTVRLSCAGGIAVFPEHGAHSATLLNRANVAMYRARGNPADPCCLYGHEPTLDDASLHRQRVLVELHHAIDLGQLSLAFQPKVELHDGQYMGAEVLVRWNSPALGAVSPGCFIPIAEDTGLIRNIGEWVLDEAIRALSERHAIGRTPGRLAVNVSGAELGREDFASRVIDQLDRANVDASALEFEITETAMMTDADRAVGHLRRLRALGATITLDDFGTGYSAFSLLRRIPVDTIKIAPEFIAEIANDASTRRLVAAMITMAHAIGLTVVAEGIETRAQARCLSDMGCDYGQGFLFARPMPATDFDAWLLGQQPSGVAA